jgi:hypothetical protein
LTCAQKHYFSDQVRVVVPFEDIFEILSSASTEIGLCQERIGHPEPRDDPETHLEDLESNMTTFLYLTVILSKIIKVNFAFHWHPVMKSVIEKLY